MQSRTRLGSRSHEHVEPRKPQLPAKLPIPASSPLRGLSLRVEDTGQVLDRLRHGETAAEIAQALGVPKDLVKYVRDRLLTDEERAAWLQKKIARSMMQKRGGAR